MGPRSTSQAVRPHPYFTSFLLGTLALPAWRPPTRPDPAQSHLLRTLLRSLRPSGPSSLQEFPVTAATNRHKLGGLSNWNTFSHSSGGWKPTVKVSAGPGSSREGPCRGGSLIDSSSSWWHQAFLGEENYSFYG